MCKVISLFLFRLGAQECCKLCNAVISKEAPVAYLFSFCCLTHALAKLPQILHSAALFCCWLGQIELVDKLHQLREIFSGKVERLVKALIRHVKQKRARERYTRTRCWQSKSCAPHICIARPLKSRVDRLQLVDLQKQFYMVILWNRHKP